MSRSWNEDVCAILFLIFHLRGMESLEIIERRLTRLELRTTSSKFEIPLCTDSRFSSRRLARLKEYRWQLSIRKKT